MAHATAQAATFFCGWLGEWAAAVGVAAGTRGLANAYSTQHLQEDSSTLEGKRILCGHSAPFPRTPPLFSPPQS